MDIVEELRGMLNPFYDKNRVEDVLKRLQLELNNQVMLKNGMVVQRSEIESFTNVWEK